MATYNRITPATLANLSPTINDPQDTEDANKLAQVDLQTRRFVYDYLSTKFDTSTEKLLASAIDAAVSLAGLINGSTSNSGTQRQIVQGTVSTPDLRDLAVSTAKLADGAVTTVKITDGNVTTAKLNDLAVTAAKIANTTITDAQLASNSVTTAKITDANVTTNKINDGAVTAAKHAANSVGSDQLMLGGAEAHILVAGVSPFKFASKAVSGAISIDKDGVTTLVAFGTVEVEERAALNTAAGGASATTWNERGSTVGWVKVADTLSSSFLTTPTDSKLTLAAATYLVEVSSPAYNAVGTHQVRINHYNSSNASLEKFYGSSESAPTTVQTRSRCCAKVVMAAGDYLKIEHWTTSAVATNGLGLPTNATGGLYEIYCQVKISKVGA